MHSLRAIWAIGCVVIQCALPTSGAGQTVSPETYIEGLDALPAREAFRLLYRLTQELHGEYDDDMQLGYSGDGTTRGYVEIDGCERAEALGMGVGEYFPRFYLFAISVALQQQFWYASLSETSYPPEIWQRLINNLSSIAVTSIELGRRLGDRYLRDEGIWVYPDSADIYRFAIPKTYADLFEGDYIESEEPVDLIELLFYRDLSEAPDRLYDILYAYYVGKNAEESGLPPPGAGGCGAGEAAFTITTDPPGALVSYIPVFDYRLCEELNMDPNDRRRCSAWQDAVMEEEYLSGRYRYIVTWPDGRMNEGTFEAWHTGSEAQIHFTRGEAPAIVDSERENE